MTVYIALVAGIMTALYQDSLNLPFYVHTALKIGGIVFTLIFWSLDYREILFFRSFRARGIELEKKLGYKQMQKYPSSKMINSSRLIGVMYLFMLAFWIGTFFWG